MAGVVVTSCSVRFWNQTFPLAGVPVPDTTDAGQHSQLKAPTLSTLAPRRERWPRLPSPTPPPHWLTLSTIVLAVSADAARDAQCCSLHGGGEEAQASCSCRSGMMRMDGDASGATNIRTTLQMKVQTDTSHSVTPSSGCSVRPIITRTLFCHNFGPQRVHGMNSCQSCTGCLHMIRPNEKPVVELPM